MEKSAKKGMVWENFISCNNAEVLQIKTMRISLHVNNKMNMINTRLLLTCYNYSTLFYRVHEF